MPAVCISRYAARRPAEHTQNRRLVIGLGRLRQEVEIALDEPRDRGAAGLRVALRAPNHLFVHAERQLGHIRMIARTSYVSLSWPSDHSPDPTYWAARRRAPPVAPHAQS